MMKKENMNKKAYRLCFVRKRENRCNHEEIRKVLLHFFPAKYLAMIDVEYGNDIITDVYVCFNTEVPSEKLYMHFTDIMVEEAFKRPDANLLSMLSIGCFAEKGNCRHMHRRTHDFEEYGTFPIDCMGNPVE